MRIYYLILISIILHCVSQFAEAQDFQDQFNQFKTTNEKAYDEAVRAQDSIFARSIIENWKAIQLNQPEEKVVESPKPEEMEVATPSLELKEVQHKVLETSQPKLMRSFNQPKLAATEGYDDFELSERYVFHGEQVSLKYSGLFLKASKIQIRNEKDLANFWQSLSKLPYQNIVQSLFDKSQELNLPDYGYLLLIDSFLDELGIGENKEAYKWFLLAKSGYKSHVGLIDGQPVLVIASYGKIYGKRYFSLAGVNYYVMSDLQGDFQSYQTESDEDENLFDFSLKTEIKLPLEPVKKDFVFDSDGQSVSLSIYYNANLVKLLSRFPQSDLTYYLSSSSSDLLKKSLEKTFKPYLEPLSEVDQVTFLMRFVQKAFDYQTDQIQFGKERVMYPEELFHHDYADCDDRVVLLAFLLRTFTDVPVIALSFPQHIALGVRLPNFNFGESIEYKGYTFAFCDPTYFNAPLGAVIPKADRTSISVIEF